MKVTLNLLILILAIIGLSGTASAATYFTGNLSAAQEVPTNASTGTGFGRVTLNDAETQITASVYYSGLTSPGTTVGHIHGPAAVGVNGPVMFNLAPTAGQTSGSVVNATFAVTASQVADLKAGLLYFNIHTTTNPGGEIRGQITVDAPYLAYMSNRQENPATTATGASGSGAISINAAGTQAIVTMNWSNLSGNAVAGHVHSGRSGVNGPIVCNLSPAAAASGSVTDFLCTFSAAQITALKNAQLYLNVHTAANPGGEVRGQIQRRRSTVLDFDGDSKTDYVVARNNSPTTGLIEWFTLNSGTSSLSATQWGQSSDFNSLRMLGGDYDGDGKDDITIWRSAADANFLILQSSNNTLRVEQFGSTGDDPRMVYDYDGDGRTDPAVWRSGSPGFLFYRPSANNPPGSFVGIAFGQSGDFPNPGDFDGDGRGDICVQRSTQFLCQNTTTGFKAVNWGLGSDFGVPGDYDGDGKTDINVVRTVGSNRVWFPLRSLDGAFQATTWGTSAAVRTQGDYDGDGKTDVAVWQTSSGTQRTYYVLPSNGNPFFSQDWGLSTDTSINAYNVR
jgi:CHRD domain/FG-GAP-like repeat